MPRVHVQSEVHRSVGGHQPQRRRAAGRHPQPDPAEEAAVLRGGGAGVLAGALVQVPGRGAREHEGEADADVDLRQGRHEVQKL